MLCVISPAKRLNPTPAVASGSTPAFGGEANTLAALAGALTAPELERLMKISPKLAAENVARFAAFGSGEGAKQAVGLFAGDTYTGLDASSFDQDERDWAQHHLRILSGLYGLLRPSDVIQPHRLQMGAQLKGPHGSNLYDFWGDKLSEALVAQAAALDTEVLVNCASAEYFTAVDRPALTLRVITPVFLEDRPEGPRVISFWAKQARGAMARFIVQNRLTDPADLAGFEAGGYRFRPGQSSGDRMVFVRSAAAAA